MMELYYPVLEGKKKKWLFENGYIAAKSGHTRGSTADLSIIELAKSVKEVEVSKRVIEDGSIIPFLDDGTVDMGSSFDLFHTFSNHDSPLLTNKEHIQNREILRQAMKRHGFRETPEEWWHYTLIDEPYPTTYFDFVVTI